MRRWTSYFLSMVIVLIGLLLIDMGTIVGVKLKTHGDRYSIQVGKISESIVKKGNSYVMDEAWMTEIDRRNAFLLLIGEDGNLKWQYKKPGEIQESFTLSDVAGFTRWYLQDYPVYTWRREDGLLVIGLPKNSVWKYTIEDQLSTLKMHMTVAPYVVVANLLILLFLPIWITKRWIRVKERQRSEWIAGVSHDIRTPLSIVMGNAPAGGVIEQQCFRIRDLIGNLNAENKLESGTGKWNTSNIKLAALIRQIVCEYCNFNEEKYSFDLNIDPELEEVVIKADEGLIRRMIDNLITNAIRHNEEGCKIEIVLCVASKNKIRLRIIDHGIGVSKGQLKKLNKRLKNEYLPEHGLGIRVVKQIAKRYHYQVTFQSESGSYFACDILLWKKKKQIIM